MKIAALLLGLLALPASAADDTHQAIWFADFDEAAAVAKEQGKDLFVDFTGSDWCGWCIRLHKEVFDHEEFLTAAQKNYVLVALDYPSGEEAKAKVPNPKRNEELSEKYGIQGFPTILLMTADGEVFAKTGYRKGGPEAYVEHMGQIAAHGKVAMVETKKAIAEFEAASGEEKVKAWEQLALQLEGLDGESPFADPLAKALRWALTFDADGTKGLKKRLVETYVKKGIFDDEIYAAGIGIDPKNEDGLYEKLVELRFGGVRDDETARAALTALDAVAALGFKDTELGFGLTFQAAMWSNGPLEDPEGAKRYAEAAKAIGSEEQRMLDELDKILDA